VAKIDVTSRRAAAILRAAAMRVQAVIGRTRRRVAMTFAPVETKSRAAVSPTPSQALAGRTGRLVDATRWSNCLRAFRNKPISPVGTRLDVVVTVATCLTADQDATPLQGKFLDATCLDSATFPAARQGVMLLQDRHPDAICRDFKIVRTARRAATSLRDKRQGATCPDSAIARIARRAATICRA
jgi:hypothetical protein